MAPSSLNFLAKDSPYLCHTINELQECFYLECWYRIEDQNNTVLLVIQQKWIIMLSRSKGLLAISIRVLWQDQTESSFLSANSWGRRYKLCWGWLSSRDRWRHLLSVCSSTEPNSKKRVPSRNFKKRNRCREVSKASSQISSVTDNYDVRTQQIGLLPMPVKAFIAQLVEHCSANAS